jgi:ParB/RepB/Spo0J family partition protein
MMVTQASESTINYKVDLLPISEIFADPTFNCRGEIQTVDIVDIAADIANRGLDSPVIVRPYPGEHPEYKWHLIAGHRRHAAFLHNYKLDRPIFGLPMGYIPAFVRTNVSEMEARKLNLRENLHRQNLNPLQEARALKYFLDCKGPLGHHLFTDQELADVFGQSRGWVQNRRTLLTLPVEIQEAAASGLLTADHIKKLAKLKNREEQFELVRKIKDAKLKDQKLDLTPSIKRAGDALRTRCRSVGETEEMADLMYDILGPNLGTRFAAWQRGIISTVQLMHTVKETCEKAGIEYKEPSFIKAAVAGTAA